MSRIVALEITDWLAPVESGVSESAIETLEAGHVAFLPHLAFMLSQEEVSLLSLSAAGKAKNISFDSATGQVRGVADNETTAALLKAMMARFASHSRTLLDHLLPRYAAALKVGRTSFRPTEIRGRVTSWRKDDTRLHVDSFPSSPVGGNRILRLFANINPNDQSRTWRLGEQFEQVAARHLPHASKPIPGSSHLMRLLRITKARRTPYDHYMLKLHDLMKADGVYQREAEQIRYDFPAGSTWLCFTDQVSHAAIAGQHVLEQTFYLPVAAMHQPEHSPLHVIERLMHRPVV